MPTGRSGVAFTLASVLLLGMMAESSPVVAALYSQSAYTLGVDHARDVALGDLDRDGDLDVVVGNDMGGATTVWWNGGGGAFSDSGMALGTFDTYGVALGDLDGDGDLDLVEGNVDQPNRVYFNGAGTLVDSAQSLGNHATFDIALGDLDGDGDLDLVEGNYNEANRVYFNNGAGTLVDGGQTLGGFNTTAVALGDVDGDGDLDLMAGNEGEANRLYLNDGNGLFTDSGQALGGFNTTAVALGDVDGDGDLDLMEANHGQNNRAYLNTGGLFVDTNQSIGALRTTSVVLGDVDGDGDLDYIGGNDFTDILGSHGQPNQLWWNNGGGLFSDSGERLGSAYTLSMALGDVDGDGDLDLVEGSVLGVTSRVWLNLSPRPGGEILLPSGGASTGVEGMGSVITITDSGGDGSTITMGPSCAATVNLPGGGAVGIQSASSARVEVREVTLDDHSAPVLTLVEGGVTVTPGRSGQTTVSAGGVTVISAGGGSSSAMVSARGDTTIQPAPGDTLLIDPGVTTLATTVELSGGGGASNVELRGERGTITIAPLTPTARIALNTVEIGGVSTPLPALLSGEVALTTPTACAPMLAVNTTPIHAAEPDTRAWVARGTDGVTLTLSAGRALVGDCTDGGAATDSIHNGESAEFSSDGAAWTIRLGSLRRDQGWTGDPLNVTGFIDGEGFQARPIRIEGEAERTGEAPVDALLAALRQATGQGWDYLSDGQADATGIWTLRARHADERFAVWPVGEMVVDGAADAMAMSGNGTVQIRVGNLLSGFAPALMDPRGFEAEVAALGADGLMLGPDGTLRIAFGGRFYFVQPDWEVRTERPSPPLDFDAERIVWSSGGDSQRFNPAFVDLGQLLATLSMVEPDLQLQHAWRGEVSLLLAGETITLIPDPLVIPTPVAHRADGWWQEGTRYYLRYPDYRCNGWSDFAQGFTLRWE